MVTHPCRGIALAGGGPLGAIYEIGVLAAIGEALDGFDPTDCGVYVGVSSGGFIVAGLANGLSPKSMHEMFIESDAADDPFEPDLLLRPALGEYASRLASVPDLLASAARHYLARGRSRGFFESFGRLARALPVGVFDNTGVGEYLTQLLSGPKRTNDFRKLKHKLFLVATDIDTGASVPFGAPGWDDVPIARAVQASAALPGLFPPVEIGGRFYVDGALDQDFACVGGTAGGRKVAALRQSACAIRRPPGGEPDAPEGGFHRPRRAAVDHVANATHCHVFAYAGRDGALPQGLPGRGRGAVPTGSRRC